jgi:hypothetical protein
MALTTTSPVHMAATQLTTAAKLLYTCPANSYIKISAATLTNTSGASSNATLHYVPAGGTPAVGTQVVSGQAVNSNGSYNAQELVNHILHPGDQIWGSAGSGQSINANISGIQFS